MQEQIKQPKLTNEPILYDKQQLSDNLDQIIEEIGTKKTYSFSYEGLPKPNSCSFSLTTEPVAIGKILRLSVTVKLPTKTVEGYVYTTVPDKKTTSTIAILNKAWTSEDSTDVEGTGLMKLASATLMALVFKKHSIAKFGGILGKIVSDNKVVRSRPDGTYGTINFNTNYNSSTRTLITTLS